MLVWYEARAIVFGLFSPGRCIPIFESFILYGNFLQHILHIFCEISLEWMPLTLCQHWFRLWLGAVRQQAIMWVNIELYGVTQPEWIKSRHHMYAVATSPTWNQNFVAHSQLRNWLSLTIAIGQQNILSHSLFIGQQDFPRSCKAHCLLWIKPDTPVPSPKLCQLPGDFTTCSCHLLQPNWEDFPLGDTVSFVHKVTVCHLWLWSYITGQIGSPVRGNNIMHDEGITWKWCLYLQSNL